LTDKGLGNILGDILTNSSGQPAANARFGVWKLEPILRLYNLTPAL
jgi:hypothetical protein